MTDRPIIFSAPMVRALLDGRKTQTRRVLKPQPKVPFKNGTWYRPFRDSRQFQFMGRDHLIHGYHDVSYAPGDRLWVREAWTEHHPAGVQGGRFSLKGRAGIPGPPPVAYRVIYRADGDPIRVWHCDGYPYRTTVGPRDEIAAKYPAVCSEFPGWTSSIHMPRWASRLTLTVTDVRVQRLQEISEEDADAEGFGGDFPHVVMPEFFPDADRAGALTIPQCFAALWNTLHGPNAWDANPWVCALTFTVAHHNIDGATP